ncbi:MAG: AAA family ATPase [Deltaproteobacteria bacterium]|nr:AAA family ATPase [Deltaproteobacteria bacterium]
MQEVTLRNFLSFGPKTPPLPLRSLNVLIGANSSGKSNLIEAFSIMRSTPREPSVPGDLRDTLVRGGGVGEWVWKGARGEPAKIDVVVSYRSGKQPLRHVLAFRENGQGFRLDDERVENERRLPDKDKPYLYYDLQGGHPAVNVGGNKRHLARESVDANVSILAQRRDPETYPEITYLADLYGGVRIYQEWAFGRRTVFRGPQKADTRNDRLEEDFSNLGLFLNRLRRSAAVKKQLLKRLRDLYDDLSDFDVSVEAGTVQVFFTEGDFTIPATRLSDGTLRYLCLLAILCDPKPPPLICIEEPELGLHPDILPKIADLLIEASSRTQLIVTTHSDIVVDALSERPESVVVCERVEGQTVMKRLEPTALNEWLDKYRLGQLWTKGELGGTRW